MRKKLTVLLLIVALLLSLATGVLAGEPDTRPIIIQGAMDLEVLDMVAALKDAKEITYGSWTFWEGTLNNYPVVVSRTEVGITNAAAATTLAIEKYNPRLIINQGTSGGHDPALHRFDIVLGEKSINFGKFKSNHGDLGQGIKTEQWIPENVSLRIDGQKQPYPGFLGDKELIGIAENVAPNYSNGKIVKGIIATADEWNRELDRIKWVHDTFDSSAEEMETASSAQVAEAFNIPFLGIRILSNSEPQAEDWDPKAGAYCQEYVLEVAKAYIKQAQAQSIARPLPSIYINGQEAGLTIQPIIQNGTIYLPLKELVTKLGGTVSWDSKNFVAAAHINGKEVLLPASSADLISNGVMYISADKIPQITDFDVALRGLTQVRIYKIQ